jgi:hypothetical protein
MSSPAAARMRRYRARKRLVRVLNEARDSGVPVQSVYEEWLLKTVGVADQGQLDRLTRHLALGDPPEEPPDQV